RRWVARAGGGRSRGAPLAGRRLPEGQAPRAQGAEGTGASPLRSVGGGSRSPRPVAARNPGHRLCLARRSPRRHGGREGDRVRRGARGRPGDRFVRGDRLMQGKRLDRVNQLIKEEVSMLLQRELKDPRLGFVTVTEVDTSKDLRQAKIFVSVL